MRKIILILAGVALVSSLYALDLPGSVSSVAASAANIDKKDLQAQAENKTDIAMAELTKNLKNVQNEKGPIVFKTGSAVLDTAKCEKTLKAIHEIITAVPGYLVLIEGHTDNAGNPKANLALSQKRAEAVRAYLVKKYKTQADRLKAKGFGDTQPIADNKTAEGKAKNRRVDFSVSKIK